MEEVFSGMYEWFKKFSPYVLVGTIGAIVHRLRTEMSWKQFLASVFIAILVSLSVGIVAQEYTVFSDDVIFILCGISGTFSRLLLDELEEIISDLSEFVRQRLGMKKKPPSDSDSPKK
tara:strand:+ start:4891 stop:5244 length:354 start_codon:yes stop_codon:yes gene_type:complete